MKFLALLLLAALSASAETYIPSQEKTPHIPREFRAAWIATVYNIDWPSKSGLSAAAQKAEAISILDKLAALKINAVILQVRPQADALYESKIEPWSPWLTGIMGKNPGYDPLLFWVQQAHARGIELHAWFNPFRALPNTSQTASSDHISKTKPHLTRSYNNMLWLDPAFPETRQRALDTIIDVVRRYDIDGVHLDDYFYPYPVKNQTLNDGKTPAQRRAFVDAFIYQLYTSVKKEKPWVRVGISPFGIWRPGVPSTIEAGVDSFEHLAGDSKKWLVNNWVDYLAPQLYWRIEPQKQSFPTLLEWWRQQGTRPVWPGIATSRIQSPDDPGRPASEIINQISLSRKIGKNWHGHIHWSSKALTNNQGNIAKELSKIYTQTATIPPMTWLSKIPPSPPSITATSTSDKTTILWDETISSRIVIQARYKNTWHTLAIRPSNKKSITIPKAEAVAASTLDRFGNTSSPTTLSLPKN